MCPIINEATVSKQEAHELVTTTENLEVYDGSEVSPDSLIGELQEATTRLMMVVREEADLKTLLDKIEEMRAERLEDLSTKSAASARVARTWATYA